jgi:GrpB-like predicted nucleotidyltransferase (UPF0157 family)
MTDKKTSIRKIKQIVLVPHDPHWSSLFQDEARQLAAIFGLEVISIHHAGSTAIQGIKAKPILDFLIIVRAIHQIDQYDEKMIELGYEAIGENGIPGRRFFTRTVGDTRIHNVHIFEIGHPEIERMLDFRDYMRTHPKEAQAYSRLKESLAKQYPGDIDSYTEGKSEFINAMIRKAWVWRKRKMDG